MSACQEIQPYRLRCSKALPMGGASVPSVLRMTGGSNMLLSDASVWSMTGAVSDAVEELWGGCDVLLLLLVGEDSKLVDWVIIDSDGSGGYIVLLLLLLLPYGCCCCDVEYDGWSWWFAMLFAECER